MEDIIYRGKVYRELRDSDFLRNPALPFSINSKHLSFMEGKRAGHFPFSGSFAGFAAALTGVLAVCVMGVTSQITDINTPGKLEEQLEKLTKRNGELQETIKEMTANRDIAGPVAVCPQATGPDNAVADNSCLLISTTISADGRAGLSVGYGRPTPGTFILRHTK